MVIRAFMKEVAMEPDHSTGGNFYGDAVFVSGIACEFELLLLRAFEVVVLRDIPFMAAGDNIEAAVVAVGWVYGCPCADGGLRVKSVSEIEFVLMPRETEPDFRCLPDEQRIDTEDIRAEDIDERIGEAWVPHACEEFWAVAARMVDLVHRVDAVFFYLPVSDECVLIDVRGGEGSFSVCDVLSDSAEDIVLFGREDVQADEVPLLVPVC